MARRKLAPIPATIPAICPPLGRPFDIGIEQRFSHDLQRQPHHFLMRVVFFPPRQPFSMRCVYSTIVGR